MDFIIQLLDTLSSMKKSSLKGSHSHIMRVNKDFFFFFLESVTISVKLAMSSGIQDLI